MPDSYANGICSRTAANFETLARLRGVTAQVTWDGSQYVANGEACGPSVHGLYEWLEKQLNKRASNNV